MALIFIFSRRHIKSSSLVHREGPSITHNNASTNVVKKVSATALITVHYRTNSMYWDRLVSANSADQDQTASEEAV